MRKESERRSLDHHFRYYVAYELMLDIKNVQKKAPEEVKQGC